MAKIGIDARSWQSHSGGIGRYTKNLVSELARIDSQNEYVIILTPAGRQEYNLTAPNFRPLTVPIANYSYAEQTRLVKILNQEKFDLVHFTHFSHPLLYRRPIVVTVHDLIMHLYPSGQQNYSTWRKLAYRLVMTDCRRAKKIIVPSQSTRDDLVTMLHFPPERIVVTPEGSEKVFRVQTDREKIAVKERLKLPKKYLLFVSRWEKYKGLSSLLKSYQELSQADPELGMVICGRPDRHNQDMAAEVAAAQASNSKIVTPGFVGDEDLAAIYSAAAVYVHPSWYEGFGIMILEAFAAGVPVVTSNTSSLPEVVGEAGLMVDPTNVTALTAAIKRILAEPKLAAQLTQRGYERVKQFSWANMAATTLGVYQQVLGQ